MTSASMSFGRSHGYPMPRGAILAGHVVNLVIKGLHRLDQWMVSRRSDEPQTADDVLAWASRIEASDPGFAADLRAAALRSMGKDD